jgi:hypothetical protein
VHGDQQSTSKGTRMGKNPNTIQKRLRELDKKRKADDKRKRRAAQKNAPATNENSASKPSDDDKLAE